MQIEGVGGKRGIVRGRERRDEVPGNRGEGQRGMGGCGSGAQ